MAAKRRKRDRTTEKFQRYWEDLLYTLEHTPKYLQPGQAGYIEGENPFNPDYIESLGQRLKLQMQCMIRLQSPLPIHEAEQRVMEAEQKLMQLL